MTAPVQIGTSGWSFQDWKGPFYPPDIPDGQMLEYYSRHFHCAEINSTYYNISHPKVFEHLVEKTPEEFEFITKFHQRTTHTDDEPRDAIRELENATKPLREAGKLSGYLAQFPYRFKNNERSRRRLFQIREELPDTPIFVEFRHESWLAGAVYRFLEQHHLGYVCVDQPQLKGLLPPQEVTTAGAGYVRLHGRNKKTWFNQELGDRYDYNYSREEMAEWLERVQRMSSSVSKLYIYFNNCHHGQAPMNARTMQSLFDPAG